MSSSSAPTPERAVCGYAGDTLVVVLEARPGDVRGPLPDQPPLLTARPYRGRVLVVQHLEETVRALASVARVEDLGAALAAAQLRVRPTPRAAVARWLDG